MKNKTTVYALVDDNDEGMTRRAWRLKKGYAVTRVYAGKTARGHSRQSEVPMHRMLMGLATGDPREVDHRNRNRLDNQRSNLRICTRAQNAQNQGIHRRWRYGDKPAYRGVHWDKRARRYKAAVGVNGCYVRLGYFDDPVEAAEVVAAWRRENLPFSTEEEATEGGYPPQKSRSRETAVALAPTSCAAASFRPEKLGAD
jgi:hypothetical protein